MPCKIRIKEEIYNEAEVASNAGLGMNIKDARKLAAQINRSFGAPVVEFTLGDTIERAITVPETLIREYYDKEFAIELAEARALGAEDAARAGIEYNDRYLYGDTTIDYFDDDVVRAERDRQIADALSEKFTQAFGVESRVITEAEAQELLMDSPTPLKPGVTAFFYGDTVYFIEGKFNSSNVLHEFSHPLMKAVLYQNHDEYPAAPGGHLHLGQRQLCQLRLIKLPVAVGLFEAAIQMPTETVVRAPQLAARAFT